MGLVRAKLHHAFCVELGGGGLFTLRDCVDHCSLDPQVASRQIWLQVAGQVGIYLCGGGLYSRTLDLFGLLPVCLALDRGLV